MRYAAAVALIGIASARSPAQPTAALPTADEALALARAYLARWHGVLASMVAEEDLRQQAARYSAQGSTSRFIRRRNLKSEVLLLRAPADDLWLWFRDVIEVDGKPVHDRQRRFDRLFSGPEAELQSTAERIAAEGVRYNLGRLQRTLNTPAAALVFLDARFDRNTTWRVEGTQRLRRLQTWKLGFEQRTPPFAVRIPAAAITPICTGRFWLEPGNGAIRQSELEVRAGVAKFRVLTVFDRVPSIREGLVPVRLVEEYDAVGLERLSGIATYSRHRLFRTGGRVIAPGA